MYAYIYIYTYSYMYTYTYKYVQGPTSCDEEVFLRGLGFSFDIIRSQLISLDLIGFHETSLDFLSSH